MMIESSVSGMTMGESGASDDVQEMMISTQEMVLGESSGCWMMMRRESGTSGMIMRESGVSGMMLGREAGVG